jgi:acetyl esterase/lipase
VKAPAALGRRSAIALIAAAACPASLGQAKAETMRNDAPLTTDSTVGDVLAHAAFAGFGRLLFPWDDRSLDEAMKLGNVASLMPYHSHVEPRTIVAALNRMIAEAEADRPIVFDFRPAERKRLDPTLRNTALFFVRGRRGAPFALIAPGGGFAYVGALHEGFPYAEAISRRGFNAFVLRYRAGSGGGAATEDMAAALSWILANAERLGVDRAGYSLWGSSAGARMAAAVGTHGVERFGFPVLPKPAAVIMAYTAHSDHGPGEPPTFVVVGEQDGIAPPEVMERRVLALRDAGTTVAYRTFPRVGHGFGPGTGTSAEGWIDEAVDFWEVSLRGSASRN